MLSGEPRRPVNMRATSLGSDLQQVVEEFVERAELPGVAHTLMRLGRSTTLRPSTPGAPGGRVRYGHSRRLSPQPCP